MDEMKKLIIDGQEFEVVDAAGRQRITVLENTAPSGGGLSITEKNLILQLFGKAAYSEDDAGTAYETLSNLWTGSYHSVAWEGAGYTHGNSDVAVEDGESFTSTITANNGKTIESVTVTMGGETVQGAYSGGTITIPNVTGDIVITVVTEQMTVSSISAVYTQSGTVYNTDTLDSLKADLVVTGTFPDSSTAVIDAADYTLSGTLLVGTSTITVSYGGKTTSFNVSVSEYVEPPEYELTTPTVFNGTSDYVDTGYVLTNKDKDFSIAIEFEPNAPENGATLFDTSHNGSGAFQFWLQSNGSGNYRGQIVTTGVTLFNKSGFSTNAKVVFVHTVGESTINAYISLDGGAKQTVTITLNNFGTNVNYLSTTQHLILGARYNLTERFFKGTIKRFLIYEDVMTETAINNFLGVN